jgi:hypothetical protein
MPIYRFQIDVNAPPQVVAERLRTIVGEKPGFGESMAWRSRTSTDSPFIGTVKDGSFKIQRNVRSRNSFLPLIWGLITPTEIGARLYVTMFLHPLVALFMIFWLAIAGNFALTVQPASLVGVGMFIFGVVLTVAGFFPEAIKAKRLISEVVRVSPLYAVGGRLSEY